MENFMKSWWVWALRGIFAIIFGVLAIFFPGDALQALVYIFGAYVIVDGAVTLYNSVTNRTNNWGWHFAEGIISILAGFVAFLSPALTGLTLLLIIGFWAVFTGVMQIVAAWRMREEVENEIWLGLAGIMSVIFGLFIFFNPLGGALATAYIIATYSIVFGVMFLMIAFRLNGYDSDSFQNAIPTT